MQLFFFSGNLKREDITFILWVVQSLYAALTSLARLLLFILKQPQHSYTHRPIPQRHEAAAIQDH